MKDDAWAAAVVLQLAYNCGLSQNDAERLVEELADSPAMRCSENPYDVAEALLRERDRVAQSAQGNPF